MDNNEILYKTFEKENVLLKENYEKIIENIKEENEKKMISQEEKYRELEDKYNQIEQELNSIKHSKFYRTAQKIKRIIRR